MIYTLPRAASSLKSPCQCRISVRRPTRCESSARRALKKSEDGSISTLQSRRSATPMSISQQQRRRPPPLPPTNPSPPMLPPPDFGSGEFVLADAPAPPLGGLAARMTSQSSARVTLAYRWHRPPRAGMLVLCARCALAEATRRGKGRRSKHRVADGLNGYLSRGRHLLRRMALRSFLLLGLRAWTAIMATVQTIRPRRRLSRRVGMGRTRSPPTRLGRDHYTCSSGA